MKKVTSNAFVRSAQSKDTTIKNVIATESANKEENEDKLAKLRDENFKKWLQNKSIKDTAFSYLAKLDPIRAVDDDSLVMVGSALCAVSRLLGDDDDDIDKKKNHAKQENVEKFQKFKSDYAEEKTETIKTESVKPKAKKRSLKSAWIRWAMEHHSFSNIQLSKKEYDSLSDAVHEFLSSPYEINMPVEGVEFSKEKTILPSLKYFTPAKPKPNEKPRPLTKDQQNQNLIFMRALRTLWNKARENVVTNLSLAVAKGLRLEKEAKAKEVSGKAVTVAKVADDDNIAAPQRSAYAIEIQWLQDNGLRKLRDWLEEDEDERIKKENEKALDQLKVAKSSHEQFVKKKDSLKIYMPNYSTVPATSAITFGQETVGIRATPKIGQTTVEIIGDMGLKYVHALNKSARKGVEGDLEKSRSQLIKLGFLARKNFDSDEAYERAKRKYEDDRKDSLIEKDHAIAYKEWVALKEMRDKALDCLKLIAKPTLSEDASVLYNPMRSSATSLVSKIDTLDLRENRDARERMLEIGKRLKQIDRSLFSQWAEWCSEMIPMNVAMVLWDFFEPKACDVHSSAFSHIRDTFLALLKPGIDYRQVFIDFKEKEISPQLESAALDGADEAEIESMRKDLMQQISITKKEFRGLLKTMGIFLKDNEIRALFDALDEDGNGGISLKEFNDFCGPKRDRNSGHSTILKRRCCWMTTCKVTGMANGYSVSNPTKRLERDIRESINQGKGRSLEESMKDRNETMPEKLLIQTLPNGQKRFIEGSLNLEGEEEDKRYDSEGETRRSAGRTMGFSASVAELITFNKNEKRLRIALPERAKREALLRRLGLIESSEAYSKESKTKLSAEEEEEETYSDDDDHNDHQGNRSGKGKEKESNKKKRVKAFDTSRCAYASWSTDQRQDALSFLLELSKEARKEQELQRLIAKGCPPSAPEFWMQYEKKVETKSRNRFSKGSARGKEDNGLMTASRELDVDGCTELVLHWAPSRSTDLVSFYSIESAGATTVNTKLGDLKYEEIFRDPEDAEANNFSFRFTLRGLQPGTSYRLRIRAFNGFGPGDYTYKTFTTMTSAPLQPRVTKVAPDSVVLRWVFSANFFKRMDELKRIFALADKDRSGNVSREELIAILDDRLSNSAALKVFVDKISASRDLDVSRGYAALFDLIEADDDGNLSWEEFEAFFMSAGWTNTNSTSTSQLLRGSTVSAAAAAASGKANRPGDVVYVVERCQSEFDNLYEEVLRTTLGQASISRLEPGRSYRFRVYSQNADGVRGPSSEPVLVHTLLETPSAPIAVAKDIKSHSVLVSWKARNVVTNTRDKAFVDKMLGDWTLANGAGEAGVSIEEAFARYDSDNSGDISRGELSYLLEDLGIEVTPEKLADAFAILDQDDDGVITFEEFANWWRRDDVIYVLKRSEEIPPLDSSSSTAPSSSSGTRSRPSSAPRGRSLGASGTASGPLKIVASTAPPSRKVAVPIVSYRDCKTRYEVAGLRPNSLYHMQVRYVGSRSSSMLSSPLVIMTAPSAPATPAIVEVTSSSVRVKLYPPDCGNGCYKFAVHMRQRPLLEGFAGTAAAGSGNLSSTRKPAATLIGVDLKDDGWHSVYNGQDNLFTCTTLSSDSIYELRVFCVNFQGTAGEPSAVVRFRTLPRDDTSMQITSRNMADLFSIECVQDVCVGDTILITEKLFVKSRAVSSSRPASASSANASTSSSANAAMTLVGGHQQPSGAYIGDRILAVFVCKDNFRTTRDLLQRRNAGKAATPSAPLDLQDMKDIRKLWLEIVWQKCTTEAAKRYELKIGDVLERTQRQLEDFDVQRCRWRQEALRLPLRHEWEALKSCYLPMDC